MKVVKLEAIPVRIPYKRVEASSLIARGGVADVLVKVTTEDGIVGWGECTRAADVPGIESAVNAMAPLVVGRSAWDRELMQRDLAVYAVWAFQPMTANFAFAGIDMALWDACGKACGQPLYRLFGGAMREEVDYFYYMEWGTPKEIARQAKDGVKKGYRVYYIKAGVDEKKEEAMLEALRDGIGPRRQDPHRRQPGLGHADGGAPAEALARQVRPRFRRSARARRSDRESISTS